MANLTNYPTENQYESQIVGELSSGTTAPFTLVTEDAVSLTLDSGQTIDVVVDPGTSKEEGMTVSAISGTSLTISARGLPKYKGGSATTTTHSGGAKIIISNNWQLYDDIATAINAKIDELDGQLAVYADAAARATAIPTPANGMQYYQTDTGKFYDYTGGAWVARESGGTFANASTTVAGKVEAATASERAAGTATGGTGALLFPTNDALVKTSSGAGDENKIAILEADGKFADGFQNISEANATTLTDGSDASALHVHAAASKTMTAGEDVDGSTTPVAVYISDGTNSRTSGRYYKCDANDATNTDSTKFFGFAKGNITTGNTDSIYYDGIVGDFAGLTVGADYYLSDTAGAISTTPSTTKPLKIGRAVSATEIIIEKEGSVFVGALTAASISTTTNDDTTFECGFRPSVIQIYYDLQGEDSNALQLDQGMATYMGTTLIGVQNLFQDATAGAITSATYKIDAVAPYAGGTSANALSVTLSVNAITDTNYTVRIASVATGSPSTRTSTYYTIAYK